MKKSIILNLLLLAGLHVLAQDPYQPNVNGTNPSTPSAYQFTKFTELPVSEYTGIPDISIPLYQVEIDDIKLPVSLSYHAVGIRVNEEAGWVGLGWDLSFGSIVQTINDVDDFYNYEYSGTSGFHTITKYQPDYNNQVGSPWEYPFAKDYDNGNATPSPDPTAANFFTPILSPQASYGFRIATDYYIPVNGTYVQNEDFFDDHQGQNGEFDSEPDIFTANFLGQKLTFMVDWTTPLSYNLVVLDKKGYSVSRISTTAFEIISPAGDQFYFETMNTISSYSAGYGLFGNSYSGTAQPNTNTWVLTKIITKNKRQVTIAYSSNGTYSNFPNYSETWQNATSTGSYTYGVGQVLSGYKRGYTGGITVGGGGFGPTNNGVNPMWAYSTEQKIYPTSITFDNGQINFFTSSSGDILGGKKLDSLTVINSNIKQFRSYKFNYGYYDTLSSPGNGFAFSTSTYGNTATLRLKLLSITQMDGGQYTFSYDAQPLPKKNSFAQDYWGYFNGQTSNTSLIPNPTQFNKSSLGNNGNNHSAFLKYARAGILTGVVYPTGGTLNLQYELNQFNNYWVPDSASSTNTVSHGNGLRVHSVTFSINGTQSLKTFYSYNVGKSIYPVNMFRSYAMTTLALTNSSGGSSGANECVEQDYNIDQVSAAGFYSSNPLLGSSGVGYDTVTVSRDSLGTVLGKTVTTFANTQALGSNIFTGSSLNVTLPALNPGTDENGSVTSVRYYDYQNNLLKKVISTYSTTKSHIYYGARIFGYSTLVWESVAGDDFQMESKSQNLIGFYPIYDVETLPFSKVTTEYANGDSLVTTEGFSFDQYDQMTAHTKYNNARYELEQYEFPGSVVNYPDASSTSLLTNIHRLSDVLMYTYNSGTAAYLTAPTTNYAVHYMTVGTTVSQSYATIKKNMLSALPLSDTITYDSYDGTFFKPLQVTSGRTHSAYIWDYTGTYMVAKVTNATAAKIAYTSFEADGSGNWTIGSATRDNTKGITGKSSYNLANGSISQSGLSATTSYFLSYWTTNTSVYSSITGNKTGYPIQGKTITINGTAWTYFEHKITGVSSVTISGTGNIDELRLYPDSSQMTTYTYEPLVGMTSQCDLNNRITYYQYDGVGRLSLVSDQDGNVVKKLCYDYYTGAVSSCSVYYNNVQSQTITRNNCTGGYVGSSVTYTVPAGRYTASTQAAADQLALNEISSKGLAYADSIGTCSAPPNVTVTADGATSIKGFTIKFHNISTGTDYNYTFPSAPTSTLCTIPQGAYNVTFTNASNTTTYYFYVGPNGTTGTTSATFNNISINTSTYIVTISTVGES